MSVGTRDILRGEKEMGIKEDLARKIEQIREDIKRAETQPDSYWVDLNSKKETLFRMGVRQLELIDLKCKIEIEEMRI